MPQHRVGFPQGVDAVQERFLFFQFVGRGAGVAQPGQFGQQLFVGRQEFVERGVQQPDNHRAVGHHPQDAAEIVGLQPPDVFQRFVEFAHRPRQFRVLAVDRGVVMAAAPFFGRFGIEQHPADGGQAAGVEEHMLGAAEADALGAHHDGLAGVGRGVGVGHHPQAAGFVGPAQQFVGFRQVFQPGVDRRQFAGEHLPGGAVDADAFPGADGVAAAGHFAQFRVDEQPLAADDAGLAQAPGHHGGVAGDAAPAGDHPGGGDDAVNVVGFRFGAHQNNPLAPAGQVFGGVGVEADPAGGGAGRGRGAGRQPPLLQFVGRQIGGELRHQQLGYLFRVNPAQRLGAADEALLRHIHRRFDRRQGGALGGAGLQQIEAVLLDGELHILHIAVVAFQVAGQFQQFGRPFRHHGGERRQRLGGADAGHHIFALGVGEEFAIDAALAGGRVAGEQHAGAAGGAEVAIDHRHNGDGGAHIVVDAVLVAVDDGAGVVPTAEHRLHGGEQLLPGVGRQRGAGALPHDAVKVGGDGLQLLGGKLVVQLHPGPRLMLRQPRLKGFGRQFQHHFGIDLDETAVGVPGRAVVAHHRPQPRHNPVIDAQIEDGVHHPRHGDAGAGTHGHQQRVVVGGELVADGLLQFGDALADGLLESRRQAGAGGTGAAGRQIVAANLGGDDEPRRHRQAQPGHFAEVAALAAQQRRHRGVALGKAEYLLRGGVGGGASHIALSIITRP